MGTVYSTVKLLSAKRALQRPFAASFFVCQYLTEIMPTIIYWLIVASPHSTDIHGYSLFHSKAVISKESAPKAFCGVRVSSHTTLMGVCEADSASSGGSAFRRTMLRTGCTEWWRRRGGRMTFRTGFPAVSTPRSLSPDI